MPRKKAAKFRCEKCGKRFTMAMHLGRHITTIHGKAPKATKPKKAAKRAVRKGRRVGRPPGVVGRLGLKNLSLEQLVDLIAAAKEEAGKRIAQIQETIR
jgi:ribosomal protein S14